MTVVLDQRVTVPPGSGDGDASPGIDDADDVVMTYLGRWVDADGRIWCPPTDPCSIGLVTAMRTTRSDGVIFDLSR
jgi:hypothetical protein